ncbi:hypothetical protein EGR_08669 [Echinococcus granulosus]|uniref:Uncharacterized protein n=1 Tax=Echinococcus granulosus TaxID=6210 RepID=W6UEI4_ECHGR|nr:hypothetical protein EGR_08669 [Echinococcus granulosus]EUB56492.1 hypothetical protein EGR_08669 [Echinococcus granulosus]
MRNLENALIKVDLLQSGNGFIFPIYAQATEIEIERDEDLRHYLSVWVIAFSLRKTSTSTCFIPALSYFL